MLDSPKHSPKSYADGVPLSDRAVAALELQQLANVSNLSPCAGNALLRITSGIEYTYGG